MKRLTIISALLGAVLVATLSGCGSNNRESSSPSQITASQACIGCHNGKLSPVTGNSIVQEYLNSAHSRLPGGPGCTTCHQVGNHPADGSFPNIPNNTVCQSCHTTASMKTGAAHFGGFTSARGITASYVSSFDVYSAVPGANKTYSMQVRGKGCQVCHNPHDMSSLLIVNKQWASSAHAAITDDPFREDPFRKQSPSSQCGRCHTGSGFRYFMTNNQKGIPLAKYGKYSSAREVIGCSSCHTDYSWKRLSSDPRVTFAVFSTPYVRFNGISKNLPANIGDTKLCIPCHAGRAGRSGAAVSAATNSPTDPHYFPAAGVMYLKLGFINFTSFSAPIVYPAPTGATTFGSTLTADVDGGIVSSTHRKLGTTALNGDSHNPAVFVPGFLDANGPCVVCHMTAGHTLKITGDTYNRVCINCHQSERGVALNAGNFMEVFVDENRQQMNDALSLAVKLLENRYDITVQLADIESAQEASFIRKSTGGPVVWAANAANPVAYTDSGQPGFGFTATQLTRLKGAMYNIQLGYKDNASFAHARTYMRRLLYDTIDYLDNGSLDNTVAFSATSLMPTVFSQNPTRAFADSTLTALAAGTTPSMTYILNFSRTDGTWSVQPRP